MRIAFDARPLNHPFTGIGVYTRQLVSRLGRTHELHAYLDRPLAVEPITGITYRTTKVFTALRPWIVHTVFPRWAREDRAELFWSPRHHLPLGLHQIPSVVTVHDMVWRVAPETMRPLNRWLEALLMPIALRRASEVIAVSQDTAQKIDEFRSRDAHVIFEAPNTEADATPYAAERPYFLFVGTREPRKNLRRIVAAFRRAKVPADLILVGGTGWGDEPDIDTGSSDKRILDLGAVPDETIAALFAGCLAVVLPSIYEGFGLPLVEGLAYGKPLITSDRGSMPEIAGDAAIYVDPLDTDAIQAAFEKIARDQSYASVLAHAARARRELFSWDRAAEQTEALMQDAIARQR